MTNIPRALAVSLLSSAFLLTDTAAFAQSNIATPPTTATRPTAPDQNYQVEKGQGRPPGQVGPRSPTQDAADVAVRRTRHPPVAPPTSIRRGAYFFSANTQITPPCGTLDSMPILLVASASWMRCASTPQPDWIAMYCVPSIS